MRVMFSREIQKLKMKTTDKINVGIKKYSTMGSDKRDRVLKKETGDRRG